ncbi:unnamed protein product [Sphacelaria rigidula]
MQVNWAGALTITKKKREKPQERHLSWVEFCTPSSSALIRGNRKAVEAVGDWFSNLQCSSLDSSISSIRSRCLLVHGPSGVWKSSAVSLCASEHGFSVAHTQSDVQRTPQKLDAVLREVSLRDGQGVLLLDEFESFIKETTSLKWLSKVMRSSERTPVVIVCNALDKSFHHIRDVSTVVEFHPYSTSDMYAVLLRLSQRVSGFCHLPPMDCYFIADMCSGNVCQTVNQVQMLYSGSKPISDKRANKRAKQSKPSKLGKVERKCMQDSTVKMWSNSHRATSVDCFVNDSGFLEAVAGMNREFMIGHGENLSREYPWYFHNGSSSTLGVLASCAQNLSAADCGLVSEDQNEDRLYESENSDLWSSDNINFIGCTCTSLSLLRGRDKYTIVLPKKSTRRVFTYGDDSEGLGDGRTKMRSPFD